MCVLFLLLFPYIVFLQIISPVLSDFFFYNDRMDLLHLANIL